MVSEKRKVVKMKEDGEKLSQSERKGSSLQALFTLVANVTAPYAVKDMGLRWALHDGAGQLTLLITSRAV